MEGTQIIKPVLRRGRFTPNTSARESSELQFMADRQNSNQDHGASNTGSTSSPCCSITKKKVIVPMLPTSAVHDIPGTIPPNLVPESSSPRRKKNFFNKKIAIQGYGKSGTIQSRTSGTSILLHRWNHSFWLHVYPATLVLFDSNEKMQRWKEYYHQDEQNGIGIHDKSGNYHARKKLVQMSINFDTQGHLERIIHQYKQQTISQGTTTAPFLTQNITRIANYALEEVRSKYYTKTGPLMHTCKVSYLSNTGRSILAAFGSTQVDELKRIRSVIRYCIHLVKKASKLQRKNSKCFDDTNNSTLSGVTASAMSALSTTKYGEATMTEKTVTRWAKSGAKG